MASWAHLGGIVVLFLAARIHRRTDVREFDILGRRQAHPEFFYIGGGACIYAHNPLIYTTTAGSSSPAAASFPGTAGPAGARPNGRRSRWWRS